MPLYMPSASGRKVDLLNSHDDVVGAHGRSCISGRPRLAALTSPTSAPSPSPGLDSPPALRTPLLARSDSYDSHSSRGPCTPVTPTDFLPPLSAHAADRTPWDWHQRLRAKPSPALDDLPLSPYADVHLPSIRSVPAVASAAAAVQAHSRPAAHSPPSPSSASSSASHSSVSTPQPSPTAATAATADRPAPKRFYCKYRKQLGCEQTFSTSGHASRHLDCHSGEKKVTCLVPGCDKKFRRADNMKQHMRSKHHAHHQAHRFHAHSRTSSSSTVASLASAAARSRRQSPVDAAAPASCGLDALALVAARHAGSDAMDVSN